MPTHYLVASYTPEIHTTLNFKRSHVTKKHSKSRFKSPLPSSYATMNDVSKESKIQCVQLVNLTSFAGQEDCLFLNIYVPENVYNDPFPGAPVMVFIHGGGLVSEKIYTF